MTLPSPFAALDGLLASFTADGRVTGLLAALYVGGQQVYLGCHGLMDRARGVPMTPGTLFRIYSMTKPITAAAVLALWDDGRLDLNDPVERYLPELAHLRVFEREEGGELVTCPLERPITLHDLLLHLSGLAYGLDPVTPVDILYQRERILRGEETLAEKIPRLARLPLLHQPGARVTYSFSYDVLSRVVEEVTGAPFEDFLRERFFGPLEMPDTSFNVPPGKLDRLAGMYLVREGEAPVDLGAAAWDEASPQPDYLRGAWVDRSQPLAFQSGGGGLVSTLEDYAHFAEMLRGRGEWRSRRVLSPAAVEKMTTNQMPPQFCAPGTGSGYGLGVLTDPEKAGLPASKGAFGGGGAAGTEFWVDPASGVVGLFLVQQIPGWSYNLGNLVKFMGMQALAGGQA